MRLTLVLWVDDKLAYHRLDDSYIPVKRSAYEAAEEGHPKIRRKANDKKGGHSSKTAKDEHRLTT
jgi:hypothetical protein